MTPRPVTTPRTLRRLVASTTLLGALAASTSTIGGASISVETGWRKGAPPAGVPECRRERYWMNR